MVYRNNDPMALSAMEEERLGAAEELQPRVCYHCHECGEPIHEDERYYEFDGDIICDNCIEHHKRTAVWEGV